METLLTFANGFSIWLVVKAFAIILLLMYLIFALVVVRQVKMMTRTLQLGFEGPVTFLSYAHLIFAIFVLLAAFTIL